MGVLFPAHGSEKTIQRTLGGAEDLGKDTMAGGEVWLSCLFPTGELEGVATPASWEVAGEASRMSALGPGSSSTCEGVCPTSPCLWPSGDGVCGECSNLGLKDIFDRR